ncbi:hypothetical protein FQB35_07165 [Crassaminicella thermophila]|uniref:Uncharacterized protein n=1 Tax=Crassaminicella thermophila TaxID=2599308 RepID=A0A5C0SD59_CRATE|nr:hypothetical protein [Crassaminicella thermophila]QEK12171.1 hypothetical protein FQB35_07165 [Crassaminicella thermophila]
MYLVDYSIIKKLTASLIIGLIIKLLDDYLDEDNNLLIHTLDKAILPYSIIFFSIASAIHVQYAVTLMSSCYIVGMFHDLNMKLSTGFKGYQESIIIFIINCCMFSFRSITTSMLIMIVIQFIDDIHDMKLDRKYGYKNFANKFGKIEIILMGLIMIILLLMFDYIKLIIVLLCYILINVIYQKISINLLAKLGSNK